jgi:hypothetical protein
VTDIHSDFAHTAAVLAVDAFLGATGYKGAVLVDLCCLPVLAG